MLEVLQTISQETLDVMKGSLKKGIDTGVGLVGYNLEAPAKQLVPFASPLRNRIPRKTSPTGTAANWKAITAVNATGKLTKPEGTRGNGVSYSVVPKTAAFVSYGLQDFVTFEAVAAGRNFQDVKATASANLLLRVMTEEEKLILGGNHAALAAVAGLATSAGGVGGTIAPGAYSVRCAALTLTAANRVVLNRQVAGLDFDMTDGVTAACVGVVQAVAAGEKLTASVTPVPGALAYAWWVGPAGVETLQIVTTLSTVTLSALVALGNAPHAADTSADALAFDGIIPQIVAAAPAGGLNFMDMAAGTIHKADGGVSELDELNSYLYQTSKIGPTRYLVSEQLHKDITAAIIGGAGAPLLLVDNAQKNQITGNYLVTRYLNKSMGGQEIIIEPHPWLPNGSMVALCESLPYPQANTPNVLEMELGYDYMQLDYAVTAPKQEFEIGCYGCLKHYFPIGCAVMTNVKPGVS